MNLLQVLCLWGTGYGERIMERGEEPDSSQPIAREAGLLFRRIIAYTTFVFPQSLS